MSLRESVARLSPSINKFDDVFNHSGLITDFGEPFGSEPVESLKAELLSRVEGAITQVTLMKIRYSICTSMHLDKMQG